MAASQGAVHTYVKAFHQLESLTSSPCVYHLTSDANEINDSQT